MRIGGFIPTSLIDYPEHVCCTIFTQGCNFKCPYCYNINLISRRVSKNPEHTEESVLTFLKKRRDLLDSVTITGGEPTIQEDLIDFISKIKKLGFLIKLDSNGSNPDILKQLTNDRLIDFIAIDIKAPFLKYKTATNSDISNLTIRDSVNFIMKSNIPYEFRTTVHPDLSFEDIFMIACSISGAKRYVLQRFSMSAKIIDESLKTRKKKLDISLDALCYKIQQRKLVHKCILR